MKLSSSIVVSAAAATLCIVSPGSFAVTLGTATVTNSQHYGYFGFASTSANNSKATIGPFSGTAHRLLISGTVTRVHSAAWLSSIQVQPSGSALAVYQPWIQFSNQNSFTGTVPVSTTVYIPGGMSLSSAINLEMFSLDSEQFVPGIDARSTLTYTFESDFAPGTVEYTGSLKDTDPTFNKPIQFPSSAPSGWSSPVLSGRFPHYDVQAFYVDTAGKYAMVSANEFESAGVLYKDSFNPASPLTNVMWAFPQTGNVLRNNSFNNLPYADDATGGTLIEADLLPGVQYYFVTSALNAPGQEPDGGPFVGRYSNVITGAGQVTLGLVPEPGSALALIALAGVVIRRRSR